jgi:signal transduction histidine kinase
MSAYIGTNFLLVSVMLISMTLVTISLSKNVQKNQIFYIWFVGLLLGSVGTLMSGIALVSYDESVRMELNTDPFLFNNFLLTGLFFYLLSMLCQPLFFFATRTTLKKLIALIIVLVGLLVLFLILLKMLAVRDDYYIRLFSAHTFLTCIILWLAAELFFLTKKNSSILVKTIFGLCGIALSVHIIWSIVILLAAFEIEPFDFSDFQINSYDLNFRFIRTSLFIFLESAIFFYWIQYFSSVTLAEKKRKSEINALILEKDKLISHLVNINLLVETGALSVGLAHEINQYLARIQLNAEEAVKHLNEGQSSSNATLYLSRIIDANQSATDVILGLKKLFYKMDAVAISGDIDAAIIDIVNVYQERLDKSNIKIETFLDANQAWSFSNTLIRQVIGNLLSNAIDALDTIDTNNKKIRIYSAIENNLLRIEINDNGPGIDNINNKNIFHLFKSTKAHGSGIGLWLCQHIISEHQGHLIFENKSEGGVSFIVTIPPARQN